MVVLAHLVICKYNGVILKLVAQCGMLCLFYNFITFIYISPYVFSNSFYILILDICVQTLFFIQNGIFYLK
jgi:hypothetical protein